MSLYDCVIYYTMFPSISKWPLSLRFTEIEQHFLLDAYIESVAWCEEFNNLICA